MGPAIGRSAAVSRANATGWAGTRNATPARPAQARSQVAPPARRGTTSVSGPGQKASARARAWREKIPSASAISRVAT